MRTTDGLVFREVGSWTAVVLLGAAGLGWVTGAVERARLGSSGLLLSALEVPVALVALAPLLAGLGAALAAARLEGRGERVALEGAGWAPARLGLAAAAVGALLGLLQWGVADHGLHRARALADALGGKAPSGWVWTGAGAVRLSDGARVQAGGGEIRAIDQLSAAELADPALDLARMVQTPRAASGEALARSELVPARAERAARRARVLGAAGLALLCWLPWSRRPSRQLGAALLLGMSWQLLELVTGALVAQGRLPLGVGWAPALALWAALLPQLAASRTSR